MDIYINIDFGYLWIYGYTDVFKYPYDDMDIFIWVYGHMDIHVDVYIYMDKWICDYMVLYVFGYIDI